MPGEQNIGGDQAQAAFVFTGKVIKSKAATIHDIATENTFIVQIEHIIKAPAMFASITGQQITVRFKEVPQINEGAIITVFAVGWIFADSIAVDALSYSTDANKDAATAIVQSSMTSTADTVIKKRVDSAQLGVVGKVVKIEKADVTEAQQTLMATVKANETETTHISEHDPNWHEATVQVDEVLKGEKDKKEVKVLFPKSDDVRWYNVQKYHEGQQGIWLLQKGKTQDPTGIAPKIFAAIPEAEGVFTALHTEDFLPLHELGKVKSLLNK